MSFKQLVYTLIILPFLSSCSSENSLNIATSANMQFAMKEIADAFEKENAINIELIVSSSGKLASQIEQGAPFDVFVAANTKYPEYLGSSGLTTSPPKVYAHGKLVLWTTKNLKPSLSILTSDIIEKIAIANPKTAPYGKATVDILKAHGIYDQVKSKLIYAESISQVNQFVTTQSVDLGFTALSVVSAPKIKKEGQWAPINTKDHKDILQAVVILNNTNNMKEAKAFYDFLFSKRAQEILNNYGYLTPENE